MSRWLQRRFPELTLPYVPLGTWPVPVERAPQLERGGRTLHIQREDLASPRYGGNKVRKLEWIFPAAIARGSLLSLGAVGSNYLLACALHGAAHGVAVEAVVVPQLATPHVRENAALLAAHARIWPASGELGVLPAAARAWRAAKAERGVAPLPLWIGGTTPTGTVGWVEAAFELAAQVEAGALPAPTDIVVPMGSGGTAAGLVLGLPAAGLEARVHAIRVADRPFANHRLAMWMAQQACALLGRSGATLPPAQGGRLVMHHGWFGPGYGLPTPEGLAAMALAEEATGQTLEPTYTGKALAACLALMEAGALGEHVLFINTLSAARPEAPEGALSPEVEVLLLEDT